MRLYIHWPFCIRRCHYCDFTARVADARMRRDYASALRRELEIWSEILPGDRQIRSVYIGGGTPSTMSGSEVAGLLRLTRRLFGWKPGAEISVEVNPASWGRSDYAEARSGGVNRVSIGAQAMEDRVLLLLGRPHDAHAVSLAVGHARGAGIPSVSLDLLYALPRGWGAGFLETLQKALDLKPHHVSLYALTLSENTKLGGMAASGCIDLPGEDEAADEYLWSREMLLSAGYQQYEISNFSLPGHECRHNLAYWRREEYLGVGAGAHSFLGGHRFRNTESVLEYCRSLRTGRLPVRDLTPVEANEARLERIMLGLRMKRGIPERLVSGVGEAVELMVSYGLMERGHRRVRLTESGMLLSNAVIASLLDA